VRPTDGKEKGEGGKTPSYSPVQVEIEGGFVLTRVVILCLGCRGTDSEEESDGGGKKNRDKC